MNPLLHEAADRATAGWLLGILTLLFLAGFGFWIWWAYRKKNRQRWEEDSRMPLNDGDDS